MTAAGAAPEEDVRQMKVAELKAALAERGLPVSGKKEELVERLLDALAAPGSPSSAGAAGASPAQSAPSPAMGADAEPRDAGAAETTAQAVGQDPLSLERMRARQARFGVAVSGRLADLEEQAARERRQARFGAKPAA